MPMYSFSIHTCSYVTSEPYFRVPGDRNWWHRVLTTIHAVTGGVQGKEHRRTRTDGKKMIFV